MAAAAPHVTEAEAVVLSPLWRLGPLGAARLIEEVRASQPWGEATVKTLLGRLIRKGAIRSERVEGRQRYIPLVSRNDYVDGEIRALLDRLFEGRPQALSEHLQTRFA